jgi:hypothetical protein
MEAMAVLMIKTSLLEWCSIDEGWTVSEKPGWGRIITMEIIAGRGRWGNVKVGRIAHGDLESAANTWPDHKLSST